MLLLCVHRPGLPQRLAWPVKAQRALAELWAILPRRQAAPSLVPQQQPVEPGRGNWLFLPLVPLREREQVRQQLLAIGARLGWPGLGQVLAWRGWRQAGWSPRLELGQAQLESATVLRVLLEAVAVVGGPPENRRTFRP